MSPQVERANASHWPRNQWHPAYASIKDWLDSEAPPEVITPASAKSRNQKTIRLRKLWRRR